MAERRKHTPDVAPGLEQLGNIERSKLAKETPRSRLLADINESLREFERNPEAHKEQIKELQELAEAFSEFEGNDEVALADTQAQLEAIKEGVLADVRGGNGAGEQKDVPGPASAESGPHPLWEELAQTITEVASRVAALDDEKKKAALKNQLELLQAYQRVKPKDRNPLWEQKARKTLAHIRKTEHPKKERSVRVRPERSAPKMEAAAPAEAAPEAVESEITGKELVTRAQEVLTIIGRKIGMGKTSQVSRELAFNIEQAQEKLASAKDFGISESGLERVRAITEKLQALAAVDWERGKRKIWEKEAQRRSFDLAIALTHAMPAEHKSAVVPKHGVRMEAFAAQPEVIPGAEDEAEEHVQAAAERHAKDDFAYLNRVLGLSLDVRTDNTAVLREQGQKFGMAFADSVSQEQMARQLREKIEFEGAPRRGEQAQGRVVNEGVNTEAETTAEPQEQQPAQLYERNPHTREKTKVRDHDITSADPWEVLGVSRDASDQEINRAYRELSRIHHVDMPEGSEEQFVKLGAARDYLLGKDYGTWENVYSPNVAGAAEGVSMHSEPKPATADTAEVSDQENKVEKLKYLRKDLTNRKKELQDLLEQYKSLTNRQERVKLVSEIKTKKQEFSERLKFLKELKES